MTAQRTPVSTLPGFLDLHPAFNGPHTYQATNEEPALWRDLLVGQPRFERAAGISSGGDVALFTLLLHSKQVVAIDHSYGSLVVAYVKCLLLQQLGPLATKALICTTGNFPKFRDAVEKVADALPAELKPHLVWNAGKLPPFRAAVFHEHGFNEMRREWYLTPDAVVKAAAKRLRHLTFVHGDLSDLATLGTFDCLYLSNAPEHANRKGIFAGAHAYTHLLSPGGLLLVATNGVPYHSPHRAPDGCQFVNDLKGYRTSWYHYVFRVTPAPIPEAAP